MTLEVLTSDVLSARHGFFTRRGGASSGVFAGLNCGRGSTDQRDVVVINRARAAEAMGATPTSLIGANQVHSATALHVSAPEHDGQRGDALVTATPGLALSVLTADCQPVLFHDPKAGVIGAAHAGWKGAVDGIFEATLKAMETLGARTDRIRAAIGPCIGPQAYEVGPEFFARFMAEDPANSRFFTRSGPEKMLFDLPGYGCERLLAAGVTAAEWIRECTFSDPKRFYSYRRATHRGEADYGRLISAIIL